MSRQDRLCKSEDERMPELVECIRDIEEALGLPIGTIAAMRAKEQAEKQAQSAECERRRRAEWQAEQVRLTHLVETHQKRYLHRGASDKVPEPGYTQNSAKTRGKGTRKGGHQNVCV